MIMILALAFLNYIDFIFSIMKSTTFSSHQPKITNKFVWQSQDGNSIKTFTKNIFVKNHISFMKDFKFE